MTSGWWNPDEIPGLVPHIAVWLHRSPSKSHSDGHLRNTEERVMMGKSWVDGNVLKYSGSINLSDCSFLLLSTFPYNSHSECDSKKLWEHYVNIDKIWEFTHGFTMKPFETQFFSYPSDVPWFTPQNHGDWLCVIPMMAVKWWLISCFKCEEMRSKQW